MNKLEISTISIIKFFAVLVGLWFFYQIREVLVLVLVLVIIVTAFEPLVNGLEKINVPRILGVLLCYLGIFALISLVFYLIIPPLVEEVRKFALSLPSYGQKFALAREFIINYQSYWQTWINSIYKQLSLISTGIFNTTITIFGGVASAVTLLILSFYSLVDKKNLNSFLLSFIAKNKQEMITNLASKITFVLGQWLRGQIALSLIVGLLDFIGLVIIGIPYALTLGILAAIVEIIPVIGPIIAGVSAIIVTLITTGSWLQALFVLILFVVVQQAENHILVPKIMGKAMGLSPVVIILAILIGAKIGGIIGAIIAIPTAAALVAAIREVQKVNLKSD